MPVQSRRVPIATPPPLTLYQPPGDTSVPVKSAISIAILGDGAPNFTALGLIALTGFIAVAVAFAVIEWHAGRASDPTAIADDAPDYSDCIGDQWMQSANH